MQWLHELRRRGRGTMPSCQADLQGFVEEYGLRWDSHDLDGIMASHTSDTTFRFHVLDAPEIVGSEAVRSAFAGLLTTWSDMRSTTERLTLGNGHFVTQYTIRATLAAPFPLGASVVQPTGKAIQFDAIDIFTMDGNLVLRKETYLDIAAALHQLEAM